MTVSARAGLVLGLRDAGEGPEGDGRPLHARAASSRAPCSPDVLFVLISLVGARHGRGGGCLETREGTGAWDGRKCGGLLAHAPSGTLFRVRLSPTFIRVPWVGRLCSAPGAGPLSLAARRVPREGRPPRPGDQRRRSPLPRARVLVASTPAVPRGPLRAASRLGRRPGVRPPPRRARRSRAPAPADREAEGLLSVREHHGGPRRGHGHRGLEAEQEPEEVP